MKLASFAALAFSAVLAGCDRNNGVKVYHVENTDTNVFAAAPATPPSASTPAPAMPQTMPAGLPAPDHGNLPQLKYVLMDGWTEKPATAMRVASFDISQNGKTADVSIVPLGGDAGGDLANVTRWRGQVGLPPATEDELPALSQKIQIAGQDGKLFDIGGASQRILGAVLQRGDTAWFFKVIGDTDLVEAQKPAFISFLQDLQFSDAAK
jgi:hypothetical protein